MSLKKILYVTAVATLTAASATAIKHSSASSLACSQQKLDENVILLPDTNGADISSAPINIDVPLSQASTMCADFMSMSRATTFGAETLSVKSSRKVAFTVAGSARLLAIGSNFAFLRHAKL